MSRTRGGIAAVRGPPAESPAAVLISASARAIFGAMEKLFGGLFGFVLCLLIGILVDQVALGIIAGLLAGAFFGTRKTKTPKDP